MKKLILFLAATAAAASFISCKKDSFSKEELKVNTVAVKTDTAATTITFLKDEPVINGKKCPKPRHTPGPVINYCMDSLLPTMVGAAFNPLTSSNPLNSSYWMTGDITYFNSGLDGYFEIFYSVTGDPILHRTVVHAPKTAGEYAIAHWEVLLSVPAYPVSIIQINGYTNNCNKKTPSSGVVLPHPITLP